MTKITALKVYRILQRHFTDNQIVRTVSMNTVPDGFYVVYHIEDITVTVTPKKIVVSDVRSMHHSLLTMTDFKQYIKRGRMLE